MAVSCSAYEGIKSNQIMLDNNGKRPFYFPARRTRTCEATNLSGSHELFSPLCFLFTLFLVLKASLFLLEEGQSAMLWSHCDATVRILRGHYESTMRGLWGALRWHYDGTMMALWWHYDGTMMGLGGHYDGTWRALWWDFEGTMMALWEN